MKTWEEALDPSDKVDFEVDVTDLLEEGELVDSYTIVLPAESELQGLALGTEEYDHSIEGNIIKLWLYMTENPSQSLTLPVEITITTDSIPPRIKQRTSLVKVLQQ